ncbi:zinc metallopeptidase [Salicibibacter cibarius]|uniref:Zinc metallopeptidase n=1 Tax=Salicibibacter cibarius TaxID=2743000 RepID=A0A7T6Z2Y6_9BACI|nr:zinc metallopeptidase [Salicibibacter cibarius]QQK76033.1 zinc metallopeptidase [Salicibibacter cibarius]
MDLTTLLIYFALIMIIPIYAQMRVKSTYNKYSQLSNSSGMTGAQVAMKIMQDNGIYDVNVEPVKGKLTDHYDPRSKTVRLSEDNYYGTSIAGTSVAAHEVGHVIQDAEDYSFMRLRSSLVPVASFGSNAAIFLIIGGMLLQFSGLMLVGIFAMAAAVVFQLVTLPVEFNASSRAMTQMVSSGIIRNDEEKESKKVLNAAALTYVAGALVAVLELVRFVLMYVMMNND